ncbi:MAG TPA: hypothetical protein VII56_14250 [Rhizomicrobium sp.]
MRNLKRSIASLPAFIAWLLMVLLPTLAPLPAYSQAKTGNPGDGDAFCTGNRFTNGDFSAVTGDPDAQPDQDINLATGWGALWSGNSLADLWSQAVAFSGGVVPSPPNGNYSGMWITNGPGTSQSVWREGMFNKLLTPINANSGPYSFTFKTTPQIAALYAGVPSVIGIYGVYLGSASLPNAPSDLNVPPNVSLFGSGNTVLLGTVSIPSTQANGPWATQTITFPSSGFGSLSSIDHVMITKADGFASQKRAFAFDDFCMKPAAQANGALKVCKVAGPGVAVGAPFVFTDGTNTFPLQAGAAPGGNCWIVGIYPVGTSVTVTEIIPVGIGVSSITGANSFDLASGTATAVVGPGVTEITYTDERRETGYLEICKWSEVAGNYTFSVGSNGTAPVTVPAMTCSPPIQTTSGPVIVTETATPAGMSLAACYQWHGDWGACPVNGTSSTVTVVAGDVSAQTIVMIVNSQKAGMAGTQTRSGNTSLERALKALGIKPPPH